MMLSAAILVDKGKLAATTTPIVKREDFSALIEARDLVAQAHRYGEELKASMHEQVEAARRAGHEAGALEARTEFSATVVKTVAEMETAFARLEMRIVNTVMSRHERLATGARHDHRSRDNGTTRTPCAKRSARSQATATTCGRGPVR
jgi:flagellar biosynthesis/type III secretory pathway protein FliH